MSDIPPFWDQIRKQMGLSTVEAIEKFQIILDFMGFKSIQTVAKLQRPKELDHFIIETSKLKTNTQFQEIHSGINLDLRHGDILVLKDIAAASISLIEHDEFNIQKNIFQKCSKYATNLTLSSVVIDLSTKPKCGIICPFAECDHVSQLASIRQTNPFSTPKFNPSNFERHYSSQHKCAAAKRKPFDDLTNQSQKVRRMSGEQPQRQQTDTPSLIAEMEEQVSQYQNEMLEYRAKIRNLEVENNGLQEQQKQSSSRLAEIEGNSAYNRKLIVQYRENICSLEADKKILEQQQQQTSSYSAGMEGRLTQYQNEMLQYQTEIRQLKDKNNLQAAASAGSLEIEQLKNELKKCQTRIGDFDEKLIIELIELMDKLCNLNDRTDSGLTNDIDKLNNELVQCRAGISGLEEQKLQQASHVRKLANDLRRHEERNQLLQQENILLRHKIMDVRSTVRAIGRIKPSMEPETFQWERSKDATTVKIARDGFYTDRINLDYIFEPIDKNGDVFAFMEPLFKSAVEGYNICVIAYGASGSGKSHTMHGTEEDPGMIPNCVEFLLNAKPTCNLQIQCSMFEIYNEMIHDLIIGEKKSKAEGQAKNLMEVRIESMERFRDLSALSNRRRKVAATERNCNSSRSHAVVQLKLKGSFNDDSFESTLMLLDLAGAENANDHLESDGENQPQRAGEMKNINQSLCAFNTVIEKLSKNEKAVDFRSSKLTHILKPFISSNCKTLMIATAAQELKYMSAFKASLSLTSKARQIKIPNVKRNVVGIKKN